MRRTIWLSGAAAAAGLLTACASQAASPGAQPGAASASQSYVVYPPPGTAAVESNPMCQLASNTAVPAAKRSNANAECNSLLSRATNPVTKPVMPTESTTPPAAQPPAPDCASSHLDARFVGGGYATGSDFGEIVIWNRGPEPCQLHGRVRFAGYYPDGSRDPNAVTEHPMTTGRITLPSNMPAPRDGHDLSDYPAALMMGFERDDPDQPDALCRSQDEGTPALLVLGVGSVTMRTANEDPGSGRITSIYGCHGRVLLEDLQRPGG